MLKESKALTRVLTALLTGAVLLAAMVLAAPPDAEAKLICDEGTLQGGLCVIVGNPPAPSPAVCPVSATVVLDGGVCFTVVAPNPPTFSCTAAADLGEIDGQCRQSVALVPGPLVCMPGFALVGTTQCIREEPPQLVCAIGTLQGTNCVIVGNPPVPGPGVCPVSATVMLEDGVCYRIITPATQDPLTCTPSADIGLVNGQCRQSVALVPGAATCAAGFGNIGGQCIRFEIAVSTCAAGAALVGGVCVSIGNPPTPGPGVCPVSATVLVEDGVCYTVIPALQDPLSCPASADLGLVNGQCRQSVALVPGPLVCDPGFGLISGQCIRFETPQQQGGSGGKDISTSLTGAAEVPGPGDPDGSGSATVTINSGQGRVCFNIAVQNVGPITGAHLHEAGSASSGPVAVNFDVLNNGLVGCVTVGKPLAKDIKKNPDNYYVNVHTTEFPAGAVRGQLG